MPSAPHARPAGGFPLGEPLLYLRAVPDSTDRNVYCTIENVYDQQVAVVRPTAEMPAWTITRLQADVQFVMLRPDGAAFLHIARLGGSITDWRSQMIQVHDGSGREVGRLRTTAPVAQFTRTSGYTLGLEANGHWLGATEIHQGPSWRQHPVPIFDGNGTSIGRIQRQELRSWGVGRQRLWFSDYLLDCPRPLPQPMPELLLAAFFAQYLYERLAQGPVNSMFGLFR